MSRFFKETEYLLAERWMARRVRGNLDADLSTRCHRATREIRAEAVAELCLESGTDFDKVVLRNGIIVGRLQLKDSHIKRRLTFVKCAFAKGVNLSRTRCNNPIEFIQCDIADIEAIRLEARGDVVLRECTTRATFEGAQIGDGAVVHDLIFTGSHLRQFGQVALDARDVLVTGSLYLDGGFRADGKVYLDSATVQHDLDCRGGTFANPGHNAIEASHLIVNGEIMCERDFTAHGEVVLSWARAESIRFTGASLTNPNGVALRADGVFVDNGVHLGPDFHAQGSVHLVGAHIKGELACTGGRFDNQAGNAIEAERLAAADVYLDRGFSATGSVRLAGAKLDRQLTCTGGTFDNPGGYALDASGIFCGGGVFLDRRSDQNKGFVAHGQVRLEGATIGTELTCTGGMFDCPTGVALNGDGLTTAGNVNLDDGFRATGVVRLARATVGRQLRCTGARLDGCGELALDLSGAVVNGDIELNAGFQSTGEVRISGAHVIRNVNFTDGQLTRIGGIALAAHKLRAGSSIMWRLGEAPSGSVDFSFAETNTLNDELRSWPRRDRRSRTFQDNHVTLEGFKYRTLDSDIPLDERLTILKNTSIFCMQQYRELATTYRLAGQHRNYRLTMIDGFRNERRRGDLHLGRRLWNWFLYLTVGYGYRIWLPFVYIGILGFGMGFVYHYAEHNSGMADTFGSKGPIMIPVQREIHDTLLCPTQSGGAPATFTPWPSASPTSCVGVWNLTHEDYRAGRLGADYPSFNAWAYSFGLLIPVANLQQISSWLPNGHGALGKFLLYYTWVAVTLGWVFGVAFAAGIGKLIQNRLE